MKKIFDFVKSLVSGFTGSLDHDQEGFSQKKILAYCFAAMVAFLHWALWDYQLKLGNFSNLAYVLGADLTFMAALLGINYAHETAIMKNGNNSSQSDADASNNQKPLNS
jgi:hypothetical protein